MSGRLTKWLFLMLAMTLLIGGCAGLMGSNQPQVRTELITVVVIVTATDDPGATEEVRVITATSDRTQVDVPDGIAQEDDEGDPDARGTQLAQGLDGAEALSAAGASDEDESPALPENCITHVVDSGENPSLIAVQYDVNLFTLLEVNGLTEDTALSLQIGDELIVPLEGCPVDQFLGTATPIPTETPDQSSTPQPPTQDPSDPTFTPSPDVTPTPSLTPTVTLAPTATDAQVEIVDVVNAGDVTAEGLRIRNTGATVNVTGWTLSDVDGNEYVFTEQIIFSNQEVTVFTRSGQDTPVARFWGLDDAVWEAGDVVTLRNADGDVQATLRLQAPIDL